jgi:hypothetical protein
MNPVERVSVSACHVSVQPWRGAHHGPMQCLDAVPGGGIGAARGSNEGHARAERDDDDPDNAEQRVDAEPDWVDWQGRYLVEHLQCTQCHAVNGHWALIATGVWAECELWSRTLSSLLGVRQPSPSSASSKRCRAERRTQRKGVRRGSSISARIASVSRRRTRGCSGYEWPWPCDGSTVTGKRRCDNDDDRKGVRPRVVRGVEGQLATKVSDAFAGVACAGSREGSERCGA